MILGVAGGLVLLGGAGFWLCGLDAILNALFGMLLFGLAIAMIELGVRRLLVRSQPGRSGGVFSILALTLKFLLVGGLLATFQFLFEFRPAWIVAGCGLSLAAYVLLRVRRGALLLD